MKKFEYTVKPILKWAGGKTQILDDIIPLVPDEYNRYIEPFFGGGALFFALMPENAVISDSNPELINVYRQVADNVSGVINALKKYKNDEAMFYAVRSQKWDELSPVEAAARTLYLNHTCFNGLYRVNKRGEFNTPFGNYKNPTICNEENLRAASKLLKTAVIVCGDYKTVLDKYAKKGDFIFLDPPYVPASEYADFKRYTKHQFKEPEQRELAALFTAYANKGVFVLETNSNAPLVYELYGQHDIKTVDTKRSISSNGQSRKGKDVIITPRTNDTHEYPKTRYMGSKQKLLDPIWAQAARFRGSSVIDLFSGSGSVSYMFKKHGYQVLANDYMHMSYMFAKAMIENSSTVLSDEEIEWFLTKHGENDGFVANTFDGLYFTTAENRLIDIIRTNILHTKDEYKQAVAMAGLIRACMKKRPRGLFTYTGCGKYDDGRRDLSISLADQFRENVHAINNAVFDNGKTNKAVCGDAMSLFGRADIVYFDPPYCSKGTDDNEYVRRYHFVEGLARNWEGVELQENTKTKKFKNYPTPFSTKQGALEAFDQLFCRYQSSVLIVSYSSNSYPDKETMVAMLKKYKPCVDVVSISYTYGFGNQHEARTHNNRVQEYLFVAYSKEALI
jgi:DNA adenine methylase